jgi:hypothetical protein
MPIKLKLDSPIYILLFLISYFVSFSYFVEPRALETSMITYDYVYYQDLTAFNKIHKNNSWSSIFQFVGLLLKFDLSIIEISRITLFISTLFFTCGIFLLAKSITSSTILSLLMAIITITIKKKFGHLEYPTQMFTEHINGQLGLASLTLIFGLYSCRNYFLTFFLSTTLLSVHLVLGAWINFVLLISILLFYKNSFNFLKKKEILLGVFLGLSITLISFIFFYANKLPYTSVFDPIAYKEYMTYWDDHRTGYGKLGVMENGYIFKSVFLFLLIIFFLKLNYLKENWGLKLSLQTLAFSIFFSLCLYVSYHFFSDYYPSILIRIMPNRFFLTHSVLGYTVIFSLIYIIFKNLFIKLNFKKINILLIFTTVLIFHSFQNLDNFKKRLNHFIENPDLEKNKNNSAFWNEIKDYKVEGYFLTSRSSCSQTLIYALKPVLICPQDFNVIPYLPKTAGLIKEIVENVYNVPFNRPKYKNHGGLIDEEIRESFEKKTNNDWLNLKSKYKINALIVPKSWAINLVKKTTGSNFIFYVIE